MFRRYRSVILFLVLFMTALWLTFLSLPSDIDDSSPLEETVHELKGSVGKLQREFQTILEIHNSKQPTEHNREQKNVQGVYEHRDSKQAMQVNTKNVYQNVTARTHPRSVLPLPAPALDDLDLEDLVNDILARHPESANYTLSVNRTADNITPLRRTVRDTRYKECLTIKYPDVSDMPSISVVIIFCNEALKLMLRTVQSILDRTPPQILREIILVDDNSTYSYLKADLDLYVSHLSKVTVIHNQQREGLVRSRMIGARTATGDVLVFFDAHMECNVQWAEPLLSVLMKEPTAIVQSYIDNLNDETLEYFTQEGTGPRFRGGFGWDLRYSWFKLPAGSSRRSDPFQTPVLVGNSITVWRDHFFRIGGFDEGLEIWGGEHFDLSFRNWLCAGRIYTVPCARVAHLYKKTTAYTFGGDKEAIISKNLMRVADIWLEEYKHIFDSVSRAANEGIVPKFTDKDLASIQKRKELKRQLKCKPFKWYLDNVLPEQVLPRQDAVLFGEVTNTETNRCWAVRDNIVVTTGECYKHRILPYNTFTLTKTSYLRYRDLCVYVDAVSHMLRLDRCDMQINTLAGYWQFVPSSDHKYPRTGTFKFKTRYGEDLCVKTPNKGPHWILIPTVRPCSGSDDKWQFMYRIADD